MSYGVGVPLFFRCKVQKIPLLPRKIPLLHRVAEFTSNLLISRVFFTTNWVLLEAKS